MCHSFRRGPVTSVLDAGGLERGEATGRICEGLEDALLCPLRRWRVRRRMGVASRLAGGTTAARQARYTFLLSASRYSRGRRVRARYAVFLHLCMLEEEEPPSHSPKMDALGIEPKTASNGPLQRGRDAKQARYHCAIRPYEIRWRRRIGGDVGRNGRAEVTYASPRTRPALGTQQ